MGALLVAQIEYWGHELLALLASLSLARTKKKRQ